MAFSWQESSEGSARAARIPAGQSIPLRISKIVYVDRNGVAFESQNHDPQILMIVSDAEGREASEMLTLSDKAGWKLAQILRAAGANMAKMDEKQIKVADFASDLYEKQLLEREFLGNVDWEEGKDKKTYAKITPIMPQPGAQQPAAPVQQPPARQPASPPAQRQPARQPVAATAGNGAGFDPTIKDDMIPF